MCVILLGCVPIWYFIVRYSGGYFFSDTVYIYVSLKHFRLCASGASSVAIVKLSNYAHA